VRVEDLFAVCQPLFRKKSPALAVLKYVVTPAPARESETAPGASPAEPGDSILPRTWLLRLRVRARAVDRGVYGIQCVRKSDLTVSPFLRYHQVSKKKAKSIS